MKPPAIVVVVLLISVAALMVYRTTIEDRSLVILRNTGKIRIGYAVEPPYAFLDGDTTVTGAFPEAAKAIVAALGIAEIRWIKTDFNDLIPELQAGRFDVIATGLYITKERAAVVDFSEPLLSVQQALLVQRHNPHALHSYADALADVSITLAVVAGSAEERLLRRMGLPIKQLLVVPDAHSGRQSVIMGLADGLALTAPTVHWMARHDLQTQLVSATPFQQPDAAYMAELGPCGFAFRQDDDQLRVAWNQQMQIWRQSAAYARVLARFGFATSATEEAGSS
jgi:polar amino acid transport system substrate-binding protein